MTHPVPAVALEGHLGILGRSGSGKSYTARGLIECLLAEGRRVCVIDPTGAHWGLRLNAAGDGPSAHEVAIFGGLHGDMPLTDTAGHALARVLAANNLPAVLDLSSLSKSGQRRFMTGFLEELYERNRDVLHLIIDEADLFVPQRVSAEMARLVGAVDDIVRRGRIFGFRVGLITQRAAVINKDVLSQIGLLIAMRSASPQDRAALEEWFKGHGDAAQAKAVFDQLGTLPTGEGFIWAPDLGMLERAKFPTNLTYDSSRAPIFGQAAPQPVTLASIDLSAVREALEPPKPEPNKGAGDSVELSDLRGQLAAMTADRDAAEKHVRDLLASMEEQSVALRRATATMKRAMEVLASVPTPVIESQANASGEAATPRIERVEVELASRLDAGRTASATSESMDVTARRDGTLGTGAKAMVALLDRINPARVTWSQAATMLGRVPSGGAWGAMRRDLRESGLIIEDGDFIRSALPTRGGMTRADAFALWRGVMPAGAAAVMDLLFNDGVHSKEGLAAKLGVSAVGGAFGARLTPLRQNGLLANMTGGLLALANQLPGEAA